MKLFLLIIPLTIITSCATPEPPFIENNGKTLLNPEYVKEKLIELTPTFRSCIMKELNLNEEVHIKMLIKFKILASGIVSSPEINSEDILSLISINCIKTALKEVRYPATGNGVHVEIEQPVNFRITKQ